MTYLAYDIAPKKKKAFACKTDTLGSLYSHPVLILTETSKSKNQVVHEQKFKHMTS